MTAPSDDVGEVPALSRSIEQRLRDLAKDDIDRSLLKMPALCPVGEVNNVLVSIFKTILGYPSGDLAFRGNVPWVLFLTNEQHMVVDEHLERLGPALDCHEKWFGYFFDVMHSQSWV